MLFSLKLEKLEAALSCADDAISWIGQLGGSPCLLVDKVDVDDHLGGWAFIPISHGVVVHKAEY